MPRSRRLDAPGCVQHVMLRGIEGRSIFLDDRDRRALFDRLARVLPESGMRCLAWTFMPNHVHLVLRTGPVRLATVTARIGTGHALHFNRRHDRVGHLFQNRYRSILVDDESYLITLVRYTHLNPVRAGLVELAALAVYPWTGHASLMGCAAAPFQEVRSILERFGAKPREARRRLASWMLLDPGHSDCAGRDRSLEAEWAGVQLACGTPRSVSDGPGDGANPPPHPAQVNLDELIAEVCAGYRLEEWEVRGAGRSRRVSKARALIVHRARVELGFSGPEIGRALRITKSAVAQAQARGRELSRSSGRVPPGDF